MQTYGLQSDYREATLQSDDLALWEKDRVRERSREIVTSRATAFRLLNFSSIYVVDLRDAVSRSAEELSTHPDEDLDYYWNARRGVPTFYAPLFLGLNQKSYLRSASLECIGEGLALYLLEDAVQHPQLFNLSLFCRPLGVSPDLMMYYRSNPQRYALVEAKATEKDDLNSALTEAVAQLIEVFKGWQNHRSLKSTDGFAVATSMFTPTVFRTSVLKLLF